MARGACNIQHKPITIMDITFYSVPICDVSRHVVFNIYSHTTIDNEVFVSSWNDPTHGHVWNLEMFNGDLWLGNKSGEDMALFAYNRTTMTSYGIGIWTSMEVRIVTLDEIYGGGKMAEVYLVLQETPIFEITAYLHRKKAGMHYSRKDTVTLHPGIYYGIGNVAAGLNDSITMRGERNGFIYHFITRKGRISIESSHRQPDPSFLEIVPLIKSMGLTEDTTLRLRTKERIDFEYGACPIIG